MNGIRRRLDMSQSQGPFRTGRLAGTGLLGAILAVGLIAIHAPIAAAQPAATVTMTDSPAAFIPKDVTVKVGDTVEWKNTAKTPHTATFDATNATNKSEVSLPSGVKPFDSGFMFPGKTFDYKFTVPGTYKYVCLPHEPDGMVGEVIVK